MAPWMCNAFRITIIICACLLSGVDSQCKTSLTVTVNRTEQTILSPNYPGPYPRPSSCTWNLKATDDKDIIVLRYRYFNVFTSVFCYLDVFSVTDGKNGWLPEIMSLCGSFTSRRLWRTTRPEAILSFSAATNGGQGEGFNISVWTEEKGVPIEGSVHYEFINYAGMLLSGCLVIVLLASCGFLINHHFKNYREEKFNL